MKLLFKQRIFSWIDSYDIYDEKGETVYTVKGQLSFGHKLFIYNKYGEHIGTIKEEILTFLPRFALYENDEYIGTNGINPCVAIPAAKVIACCSAIPISKNLFGNCF